ncbi:MAG: TIGR04283 family arsenosugar biosynthesis glycosyltransferase [Gammaproteobacteria bacterium]|nr:TIGR04283 family arsenosugar biosynthesis glycosyltransferase [Gammaproteobacteria bacterium]
MKSRSSRPYIPRKIRQPQLSSHYLDRPYQLSIIIPALNESRVIVRTLMALQPLRNGGHEVILVDGGSEDDTVALSESLVDQVVTSSPGRAHQMNTGARHAWGETLLFLHADTLLPTDVISQISQALAGHEWGRFNVRLSGRNPMFRLIEHMMNLRSCLSGIATGDQAVFVTRSAYDRVGGYAELPLMEDIDFSRRMKKVSRPACIRSPVFTSSRRWEEHGIFKTILLMWRLRLAYYLGADPQQLAKRY